MKIRSFYGLFASDPQLKDLNRAKYAKLASDDAVNNFVKAAEAKKWKVHVVDSPAKALETLVSLIPDGAQVTSTGSLSLAQIGYTEYAKNHPNKWDNIKAKLAAETDPAKQGALYAQANTAQYVVTSPSAVTESADFITGDLSGTRVGPTLNGQNLIVVVGAQKIVKDLDAAHDRLKNYALPLESARVRIAYKLPASSLAYVAEIRSQNPFAPPGRVTYILVKTELGY